MKFQEEANVVINSFNKLESDKRTFETKLEEKRAELAEAEAAGDNWDGTATFLLQEYVSVYEDQIAEFDS